MTIDEKQWASIREAFVYWANKRKANSVRSYASVREAIIALADNDYRSSGGGGDLGGLFTIIYTTDEYSRKIVDYAIGNEVFLWAKDLKILTESAAELFNSRRYTDDPYILQDGDIINVTSLLRHLLLEDVTPEPEPESNQEQNSSSESETVIDGGQDLPDESSDNSTEEDEDDTEPTRVLRIRAFDVDGIYSDGFVSARGVDNTAAEAGSGTIDEDDLWDILGSVGNNEQINLAHLADLQTWVSQNFYQRNGQDGIVTESDLLRNYTIWGQKFHTNSGDVSQKVITGNMSNVGHINMSGNIYMADSTITLGPSSGYLSTNVGFYSTSFVSARGVDNTPSTAGSDFDVDEMWDQLALVDITHKIDNSHLNDNIVTTTVLNNRLANYLDIPGLQLELQNNYTIWGQHFTNKVISGDMSNVGNVTMVGNINYVGNLYFNSNNTIYLSAANNALQSASGFYSLGFVSARGVDNTSAIGGAFDADDMWDELASVDSSKLINSSHITGFVTMDQLQAALANTVTITGLPSILQTYTVWGQHLTSVTSGDMTSVGNITMSGNITMLSNAGVISGLSSLRFGSDSTKAFNLSGSYLSSSVGFYSSAFISTRGSDPSAISGSTFDESDMWDLLENTTSGHNVNAYLIPIGSGLEIQNNRIVCTGGSGGSYVAGNGISISGTTISVISATNNNIGGIQLGYTVDTTNQRYPIELSSGKAYVAVPWSNYYQTPSYNSGLKIATGTGVNDLYVPTGSSGSSVCIGNDSRLSNDRNPTSHASTGTGYGIGTKTYYGHVKLATGDMNGEANVDGVACSKNHTHSQYLTSFTESDPIFTASAAYGITSSNISSWNGKYTKPSNGIPDSDLKESYYLASNPDNYTSNIGTITKVGNTTSGNVSVVSGGNTASFGNDVIVGTVGGVQLAFTMPDNPVAANTLNANPSAYSVLYATSSSAYSFSTSPTIISLTLRNGTGSTTTQQQTVALTCNTNGLLSVNKGMSISGNVSIVGNVTLSGSGKFYDSSDIRLKQEIKEITSVLDDIIKLPIIQFEYKSDVGKKYIGTIAQDVIPIFPELVGIDDNGYYNVNYGGLAAVCIAGIKELLYRVEKLEHIIYGN